MSGVGSGVYLSVRYAGHLAAATWIAAAALRGRGAYRGVGLALAIVLGGYTLLAMWLPPVFLAPSGPLLIAWWILVGRRLGTQQPTTVATPPASLAGTAQHR